MAYSPKTTASKKSKEASPPPAAIPDRSNSKLFNGNGKTSGLRTRYVILYGPPKGRKTTATLKLRNALYVVCDANFSATVADQGGVSDEQITDCTEDGWFLMMQRFEELVALGVENPNVFVEAGVEAVVADSITAVYNNLDVTVTSKGFERWAEIGRKLKEMNDVLVKLKNFVNVVLIAHAPQKAGEKVDKKGEWAILSLPGQSGEPFAQSCNWLLYLGGESTEWQIQTMPSGIYQASAHVKEVDLSVVRTGDLRELFVAAKLLEE